MSSVQIDTYTIIDGTGKPYQSVHYSYIPPVTV